MILGPHKVCAPAGFVAAILLLAGCGGGDDSAGDPVSTKMVSDERKSPNSPAAALLQDSDLSISGEPAAYVRAGNKYEFSPTYTGGNDTSVRFYITGRPVWSHFEAETGRLFGRPSENDMGVYSDIVIRVSDGNYDAKLPAFSINVVGLENNPPLISGTPKGEVTAGELFSFTPKALDSDGDTLSFAIRGKPGWAYFDIENGRLWGIPTSAEIGNYPDIQISVSDGSELVSLDAFALSVTPAVNPNAPPVISGVPSREVTVGNTYSFVPKASDPDGSLLTFRIENKPAWAVFDASTGELSGRPTSNDIGTKWAIVISVTDGALTAKLDPFGIRVDPQIAATRKYNAGHYIAMARDDTHQVMTDSLRPGVAGLQRRYYWKTLEPAFGKYDFSQLSADLDTLAAAGKQLIIMVEDKSFESVKPTPAYLHADYTLQNRAGGYTAKRWSPYVVQRFIALIERLGEKFDSHPAFEGIAFQETSLSLNSTVLDAQGYTPEKYRDAIVDVLNAAAASLPNSQVFWYMNFLPGKQAYLADIAETVAPSGVAMGGPDILPDSWELREYTYPLYEQFQGKLTLFNSVQYDSYAHLHRDTSKPTKYWTPRELFVFARDKLNINYIFWSRKTRLDPGDEGSYIWTDALPVIEDNPNFNE